MNKTKTVAIVIVLMLLIGTVATTAGTMLGSFSLPPFLHLPTYRTITNFQSYGPAYRYNIGGWIYLHIEGDPYERGYQHGYLLAEEIKTQLQRRLWCVVNWWGVKYKTCRNATEGIFWHQYTMEYQDEVRGIAEGAAARGITIDDRPIDYKDILFINEWYELLGYVPMSVIETYDPDPSSETSSHALAESFSLPMMHCSSIFATGNATTRSQMVFGHITMMDPFPGETWNVMLDIKPTEGYEVLINGAPGHISSFNAWEMNSAGIALTETTIANVPTSFEETLPVVIRERMAIQYSDSIDEVVNNFITKNNGAYPSTWSIGDRKTGEIAQLDLGYEHWGVRRTFNGMYGSFNNATDPDVREEQGLPREFIPNPRDEAFESLVATYYGEVDIDLCRNFYGAEPPTGVMYFPSSLDCKISDTELMQQMAAWVFHGNPNGESWYPDVESWATQPNVSPMIAEGWVLIRCGPPYLHPCGTTSSIVLIPEKKPYTLLWNFTTAKGVYGNEIYSSPTVSDGVVYFASFNGKVYALDAKTGAEKWSRTIGWAVDSSPTVSNGILYIGSEDTNLYALDAETGDIVWKYQVIGDISSRPAVANGVVYVTCHDTNLYALDAENGTLEWKYTTGGSISSSPAVSEGLVYFGSWDGNVYALDAKTGALEWNYATEGPITSSPAVSDGTVYIGSWDTNLYALCAKTGELIWKFETGWGVDSSPLVYSGTIYLGSEDGNIYAISKFGRLEWTFTTGSGIYSSPAVSDGVVYIASGDHSLYALNAEGQEFGISGDLRWCFTTDRAIYSSPAVLDGTVYIGGMDGIIYAIEP